MRAQGVLDHQLLGNFASEPLLDATRDIDLSEFFPLEHGVVGKLTFFTREVGMLGIGLRTDRDILASRHRHGAGNKPGHAGQQNIVAGCRRGRHAQYQAGGRYDPVVGAEHGCSQPADALNKVILAVKATH